MPRQVTPAAMKEFKKRVQSILWRQGTKEKHDEYDRFKERVEELRESCTYNQSIVQAAKDFPCLNKLFRLYDVSEFDPFPGSHPTPVAVPHQQEQPIRCDGRELSYRENLNWAMDAAGAYLRTGSKPLVCPNDRAFYLYIQASEAPKDFLLRLGQAELKGDSELDERRDLERSTKRGIREIEEMLMSLDGEMETQ